MFTTQKRYINDELWIAVFEDGIFFCAWHSEDFPTRFKFLLEE